MLFLRYRDTSLLPIRKFRAPADAGDANYNNHVIS